jgi:hypothetical protein
VSRYQKAEAGLLPSLKVGGLVRFVPERVGEFALASEGSVRSVLLASTRR